MWEFEDYKILNIHHLKFDIIAREKKETMLHITALSLKNPANLVEGL